jgi:DNA-binding transcriptional regulator YhcF (GntR family)
MSLDLRIDYDRGVPVYRQIYDAVIAALASGALASDEQLPTIHELAKQLKINPNTVARAYRDLDQDGYIVALRGRGTFPSPDQQSTTPPPQRSSARYARSTITRSAKQHPSVSPGQTSFVTSRR